MLNKFGVYFEAALIFDVPSPSNNVSFKFIAYYSYVVNSVKQKDLYRIVIERSIFM